MDNSKNNPEGSLFGLFVGMVCAWMILVCIIISIFEEWPGFISKLFVKVTKIYLVALGVILSLFNFPRKKGVEITQGR